MISRTNRPHFVRSPRGLNNNNKRHKFTLLCLMLNRLTKKNLRICFRCIYSYGAGVEKVLDKLVRIMDKSIRHKRNIIWKQLQHMAFLRKNNEKILKNCLFISEKYRKATLYKAFNKILICDGIKKKKLFTNFVNIRDRVIQNIFNRLYFRKIKQSFIKSVKFVKLKDIYRDKTLITISKIEKIRQKIIFMAWFKLIRKQGNNDVQQLKSKLQSIEEELMVKEKKCLQLSKLLEKNQNNEKTTLRRTISQSNMKQENSNKRSFSEQKKSDNGTYRQHSFIGSVLNASFLSFRSGFSDGQNSNNECNCGYKTKYSYYKCQASSLKNQLQIIKKQLEQIKDLNQYLQNQFTKQIGEQQDSVELEKLKKQIKQLKKERQLYRQKIMKYQKYISNLKFQFKHKMQNLYRNIKKGQ